MLYDDIIADIAAHTDASQAQVRTLFEDSGVQSVRNDNRFYRAAGLEGIVRMSDAALQTLNAGYQKCGESLKNLTLTTANTSQQEFINACNLAYMQITSGAFDYNTAIRKAVQNAAEQGSYVMYPSGHTDRLDVAMRRAVMTGVGQTVRKLSEINAADMGTDLMEITAHSGARPSHAEWQGQIVSLSGRKGYLSKSDIGYGTGDGFGGWNCRHDWFPFFEGASQRAYTPERLDELNARNIEYDGKKYTQYEISQIQRKMERDIRAAKRGVIAADTARKNAGSDTLEKQFDEDFTTASVKLKSKEKKLSDFLEKTKQLPDNARTQVLGFGRSQAQKAVRAEKKEVDKYSRIHYNKNGTIVVTDDWKSKGKISIPATYKANAVIETQATFKNGNVQIDRTIYDESGKIKTQIHSGDHCKPKHHPYGKHGEHLHNYIWEYGKRTPTRTVEELTDKERKEHSDIL